ncbi:MAG: hypothetical protein ACOCYF_02475 [Bacteroidota bacterium]
MTDPRLQWSLEELEKFYDYADFAVNRDFYLNEQVEYAKEFMRYEKEFIRKGKLLIHCQGEDNLDIIDIEEFRDLTHSDPAGYSKYNFFPACFKSFKDYENYIRENLKYLTFYLEEMDF